MEEFLDECLQDDGLITDETFQITYKYSFLGPPLSRTLKKEPVNDNENDFNETLEDLEFKDNNKMEDEELEEFLQDLPEAEPLWHLSESEYHRYASCKRVFLTAWKVEHFIT